MWRQEQCGLQTTIQNLNITVPVIDLAPTCTPTSLNAAILCKLDITLHGLHRKAGVPNHSRIILNNVNMTTIILAAERKASLAPDTSLLDRVQRIPTGPRSNIGSYKAHLHPVGIHPVSIRSFSIFPTCVWSHCVFSADFLPLWKGKRNVNITYKLLPADSTEVQKIDDLVQYQSIDSEKIKSVHGVDTPTSGNPGSWDWRGKGWLMIASSHWECLGFGHIDDGNQWIVTYFDKTLFTPAGIDVYSRNKEGLPQTTVDQILDALKGLGVDDITNLANNIFQIPQN
ncbi:hypothetical protein AAEP93_011385 [Penicillium crustosum]